jgi:hypothetical protein
MSQGAPGLRLDYAPDDLSSGLLRSRAGIRDERGRQEE